LVLRFVYGCIHKNLSESCKFYRFPIRAVYTCTRPCTSRSRPCSRPAHGLVTAVYTAHKRLYKLQILQVSYTGRVYVYTTVYKPRFTAVYGPCTPPSTWPYTRRVHGCVHGLYPWPCTRVHDCYTAVYTGRVNGHIHGPVRGRLHGPVHGCVHEPYPWPCMVRLHVCTAVYVRPVYSAVYVHRP